MPLRDMSSKYTVLQSALAADGADRGADAAAPRDRQPARSTPPAGDARRDRVRPRRISPIAAGEPVLKDLSFTDRAAARKSRSSALPVRARSTIIKLLNRFYDVDGGTNPGRRRRRARMGPAPTLRRAIGLVQQDVFIFAGNIVDNVRLSRAELDEARGATGARARAGAGFRRAAAGRAACKQMHERGCNLSAGQRQLLSFARALAYDPAVLVMDEATSSVDSETERLIQLALDQLLADRTALVIAHRLSTIEKRRPDPGAEPRRAARERHARGTAGACGPVLPSVTAAIRESGRAGGARSGQRLIGLGTKSARSSARGPRWLTFAALGVLTLALGGCEICYIARGAYEGARLLWNRKPISAELARDDLAPDVRDKLEDGIAGAGFRPRQSGAQRRRRLRHHHAGRYGRDRLGGDGGGQRFASAVHVVVSDRRTGSLSRLFQRGRSARRSGRTGSAGLRHDGAFGGRFFQPGILQRSAALEPARDRSRRRWPASSFTSCSIAPISWPAT